MKRSKIFIAGTSCLLAVVGVAATKAHKGAARTVYYTSTNGHCTAVKVTRCSLGPTDNKVCRTGGIFSRTLYTITSNDAPCHSVTGANNHIARYNAN